MNKKRLMKKVILSTFGLSILCFTSNIKSEAAAIKHEIVSTDLKNKQTRTEKLVWYYKEENGKRYMRLYDATNEVWLTDWILCE